MVTDWKSQYYIDLNSPKTDLQIKGSPSRILLSGGTLAPLNIKLAQSHTTGAKMYRETNGVQHRPAAGVGPRAAQSLPGESGTTQTHLPQGDRQPAREPSEQGTTSDIYGHEDINHAGKD